MNIEKERESFEVWWAKEGQYCRAGGGDYEKTFAYRAYQAGRAALQSQSMETSNTIRDKSYAGVYAWLGDKNIVEHIPKTLAENATDPASMMGVVVDNAISKLGRFVALQSQDREDAARIDWMARQDLDDLCFSIIRDAPHDGEYCVDAGRGPVFGGTFREAIDHARRAEGEGK